MYAPDGNSYFTLFAFYGTVYGEDDLEDTFRMFDKYLKSKDLNIVRGLTVAIELEMKSRSYYQAKSNEMNNLNGKTLLHFLANEELSHLKMLEHVKRRLEAGDKWLALSEIKPREMGKPRLFEGKQTEPRIKATSTDKDILLAAMSAERKSEEYYSRMSEKIKDTKGKSFFQSLARFERTHYETLKELLKPQA